MSHISDAPKCAMRDLPPHPVLSIRLRTTIQDLPRRVGEAYGAVADYLAAMGTDPAGPPFVAYFNADMQDLDIEAGFPVARLVAGQGHIQPRIVPGGRAAVCRHVGPYSELHAAYARLTAWMQAEGQAGTGVAYEFYLNDPETVPPGALQTEIAMPLAAG